MTNYEWNLYVACQQESVDRRMAGIVASALIFYNNELKRRAQEKVGANSRHFGEIGVRMTFTATVMDVRSFVSDFGGGRIVKLLTPEGNVATWFATGGEDVTVGQTLTVKATPKKHDNYKGVAQTVVSRLVVMTPEDIAKETAKAEKKAAREAKKAAKAIKEAAKAMEG